MLYSDQGSAEKTISGDEEKTASDVFASQNQSQQDHSKYNRVNVIAESDVDIYFSDLIGKVCILSFFWFVLLVYIPALPLSLMALPTLIVMTILAFRRSLLARSYEQTRE